MTEIPEHLRKRAEAAKQKAESAGGSDAAASAPAGADAAAGGGAAGGGDEKIPSHLLDRGVAAADQAPVAAATAVATAGGGAPEPTGPGGHTQRLLTVVKSGSIQDVKSTPSDKVHVWPHLLVVEFVAALFITGFTVIFSIFVNAPLLQLANVNETPNPSKAPWYFLGLQELLTMFHPMVAGVTIPGVGLVVLGAAPFVDKNPSNKPEDRKFAISLMTLFMMMWSVLVMIGSFFRGPGFNFVFPWTSGLFFEL